jgi:UDP-glucose 4-epimerase
MHAADTRPVLLVGASGRVGRMVLHHWQRLADAAALVPQFRASGTPGALIWDPLEGPQALLEAVSTSGGFQAMVMLAGVTPGRGQDLGLNRILAEACLEAASLAGIPRALLASSSAVYGAGKGAPISETDPCKPANDYGSAKLAMEQACAYWRNDALDLCMLRIGNVAGADALLLNVANSATDEAIEIDVFDDGRGPVRSYIGVRTLASVLQTLCLPSTSLPDVLNIGAPEPISMDALADAAHHPWRNRMPSGPTPQSITLDCSLLSSLHDFTPQDSRASEMVRQWKETLSS